MHVFGARVHLGEIDPDDVRLEMFAEGLGDGAPTCLAMTRLDAPAGADGWYAYGATIATTRPPTDFTARIVPYRDGAAVPLENPLIAWQR